MSTIGSYEIVGCPIFQMRCLGKGMIVFNVMGIPFW